MSERKGSPVRRLRAARTARAGETAASVLPGSPRVEALDALLREVDSLRLSLETDLTLAASAVEAGAADVAVDILDGERDGLRLFERRALGHLADLASPPSARRWARVSAAPFVAAAAMVVGFLTGVVPTTLSHGPSQVSATNASADSKLAELTQLAASGQTAEVRDAAIALHDQIAALVGTARTNPAAAKQALLLLSAERAVIRSSGDSQALADVLARSTQLSALLLRALPPAVRSSVPPPPAIPAAVAPTQSAAPKASSKPTPSPDASPKAGSKPSPSSSPTASSSPSSGPGLPTSPALSP
ncbi:MAG: hypothetical protein WCD35_17410 [Mycobacteriales bacterium]